ncbi:diaminobutyrate acetyltransferase [Paenibacillus aurantius]|uniref:L-2,4-diaminobutyric acid acetyltransferase n=1 Tax=Paenibacillus aurantius TaxID=2918900 RepID=A0AA96LES0_9BACL|nr:diaminobutyrate acetyltransferase [Paenibacillus aurantius]WNQ11873.1 diaminobutyrate acetyltransferase [Paenibacillus aurantius]
MTTETAFTFRRPQTEDGEKVWELIREAGTLDLNSAYCYLMLCDYFSSTCVVAEAEGKLAGFVSAFRSPRQDDTLFIWQVAVDRACRGKGLGKQLIRTLLNRSVHRSVRYLEATVSPSNIASRRMFAGLAEEYGVKCTLSRGYSPALFPEGSQHEEETLYLLGPFTL